MKILTKSIETKLRKNSANFDNEGNHKPVLKLFNPTGGQTWLFTELDDSDVLYGLHDLGFGEVELGYIALAEITEFRGRMGLGIERDMHFKADKTLTQYADAGHVAGRIVA